MLDLDGKAASEQPPVYSVHCRVVHWRVMNSQLGFQESRRGNRRWHEGRRTRYHARRNRPSCRVQFATVSAAVLLRKTLKLTLGPRHDYSQNQSFSNHNPYPNYWRPQNSVVASSTRLRHLARFRRVGAMRCGTRDDH